MLHEAVGDASNVLLLAPDGAAERDACRSLMAVPDPAEQHVLGAVTGSVDRFLDRWRDADEPPARVEVVAFGEATRSGAVPSTAVSVDTVPMSDLTGAGIQLNEHIDRCPPAREAGDAARSVFCFDSLTPLVEYVGLERTFRFLHVLTRRLAAADVLAHYHLTPAAHDDRTVAALKSLFDAVVEPDADADAEGAWRVRGRTVG